MTEVTSRAPSMLDKRHLRAAFERAATTYDGVAVLQREIADRLLDRLDLMKSRPQAILDIGSGTGYCTRKLSERYRHARVLGIDIAQSMAAHARRHAGLWNRLTGKQAFVCGDGERLPVATASVDMIVSSATLQWCNPETVFAEARRVLRPGGLLMFTTFGPDTLHELRASWRAVDDRPHVHGFLDMHDIGDMLVHAGFADPVMDVEHLTLTYGGVMEVMRDLKQLGAHNVVAARARGLTGKAKFEHFRRTYESMAQQGRIPATYEVVYGQAWVPEQGPMPSGEVMIPVTRIGRRAR